MYTINCYYEEISQIEYCPRRKSSQLELISICANSWIKHGWQFNILKERDAMSHPLYNTYKEIVSSFPSVNPQKYDYHCYIRWLAMANIGGGILIDYDVVNMGLKTDHSNFFDFNQLTIYQGHVPCVVSGSKQHYLEAVYGFMGFQNNVEGVLENNRPHTSDMIMLASGKIKFNKLNIVKNYGDKGLLIHCSQAKCKNKTKLEIMRELCDGP
jgi:hypothetical protein